MSWQPTIETIPTERGSYLCVAIGSPWHEETHAPRVGIAYFDGEQWENYDCVALTVTHWQPLPPPPEPKEGA